MAETTCDNSEQAKEIESLKTAFSQHCRIIKHVGDFNYIVSLFIPTWDLTLKFQITDTYPKTTPEIALHSNTITQEILRELTLFLNEKANEVCGKAMIKLLAEEGLSRLNESCSKPEVVTKQKARKKTTQKSKRKQKVINNDKFDEKKPPMKTAQDVLSRLLWDENLPADEMIIGYLDRFKGIVEKYFTAFSWEDIASVDYNTLAIPKHRIQYFKYKEVKVWDKNLRLDNVFGSLGSGITIADVIQKCKDREENSAQNASDNYYSSSSDSKDDITALIQNTASVRVAKFLESNEWDGDDTCWADKPQPNFFIAIRITNKEIIKAVTTVQDYILDNEAAYGDCFIPPAALHVTLCVLGLDTVDLVAETVQVLQKFKHELCNFVPKSKPLIIEHIDNFYNHVIYAKVRHPPEFMALVNHIRMILQEAGIESRDNHDFVPHMTIMKVSQSMSKIKGTKNVDPWLYQRFAGMFFGTQTVDGIHLCSMEKMRQEDGFYLCPTSLEF